MMFWAAALALGADAETARPASPRFVVLVRHYEALKDALEAGDIVVAFCVRDPQVGEDGRTVPNGPPQWNEQKWLQQIEFLDAVKQEGLVKCVVFSTIQDLLDNLKRIPKDVTWVGYNSEPGMTPAEELKKTEESVKRFADIAHARQLKVDWGPTLYQLLNENDKPLANAKHVDRVGLQHQRLLENRGLDEFVGETRRRATIIRKANPKCQVCAQVVIGRDGPDECIKALSAVAGDVDTVSAWTMRDPELQKQVIQGVRGKKAP